MLTDKQAWVLNIIASDEDTTFDALTWTELNQLGCVEPNLNEDDYKKEGTKFDLVTDKGRAALLEYEQDLFKRFDPEQSSTPKMDNKQKQHINMRLHISVEANVEEESESFAEKALIDRLEGMTIETISGTEDSEWDCSFSDVGYGVYPLPSKSIEQIVEMEPHELITQMVAQKALLSALSQMIWREVDKYDNEGLDNIGELLRPYHPDSAVSGEAK